MLLRTRGDPITIQLAKIHLAPSRLVEGMRTPKLTIYLPLKCRKVNSQYTGRRYRCHNDVL